MDYGQGIEPKVRLTLTMIPVQLQKLEILAMGNQELLQFLAEMHYTSTLRAISYNHSSRTQDVNLLKI